MIEKPELGMKVKVIDAGHCCAAAGSHDGAGVITNIDDDDSFEVKMDDFKNEEWFRCKTCVEEI